MATKQGGAKKVDRELRKMAQVRAAIWGVTAVVDASLSGAEFVVRRIYDAMLDGNLQPTTAAEVAEEARRLLQLDNTK